MTPPRTPLRLGTRASALARAQAAEIADALTARGHAVEIVLVRTEGDLHPERTFAQIGEPGVFVRALERALVEERIDVAVHSYKDLPAVSPPELAVIAVPGRAEACDRLLVRAEAWDEARGARGGLPLREGARVGTASARRKALLSAARPDLRARFLRGSVDTRVRKLIERELNEPELSNREPPERELSESGRMDREPLDAILLAAAGLDRLAAAGRFALPPEIRARDLDPRVFVPAPSQGALACQARAGDAATQDALFFLDDPDARRAVEAERGLLALVQAGCDAPFGAHAAPASSGLRLDAILELDGRLRRATVHGEEPAALARAAFRELLPERAR